jgi:predicted GH43/DUF377 family glycosyl hydrolase
VKHFALAAAVVSVCLLAGCGKGGSGGGFVIPPADSGGDLDISPADLPVGMPGAPYSQVLSAAGGTTPYTWSITSGSLPQGIDLDDITGELAGTPVEAGTCSFKVTVEDSSSPALSGFRRYDLVVTDGGVGWKRTLVDAVLTEGAGWDAGGVGMPCVVEEAGGTYKMWYSAADSVPTNYDELLAANVGIGLATSNDGITWTPHAGNPVLTKTGGATDPDGAFAGAACVLKENTTYTMWYTGARLDSFSGFDYVVPNICCATSNDGIAWNRLGLVLEGSVDIQLVSLIPPTARITAGLYFSPWVIYDSDDGLYRMWFTYLSLSGNMTDPSDFEKILNSSASTIGYATSADGLTWDVKNTAVLRKSATWESGGVASCCVIEDAQESCFKMWYSGSAEDGTNSIGFAKSGNGSSWTKCAGNPVFSPADTGWDSSSVATPSVLKDLTVPCYRMWYTGSSAAGGLLGRIGYAECP